jgi:hypothetical protein
MSGALVAAAALASTGPLFAVACVPPAVSGTFNSGSGTTSTGYTTATPANGTAPYSYSWQDLTGGAIGWIGALSDQSIAFGSYDAAHRTGQYRVTVTDALSRTASATVNITLN